MAAPVLLAALSIPSVLATDDRSAPVSAPQETCTTPDPGAPCKRVCPGGEFDLTMFADRMTGGPGGYFMTKDNKQEPDSYYW